MELALLAPFLILLLLGSIDTSHLLFTHQDVRHAAREAGRLAATDAGDTSTIATRVCDAMDNSTGAQVVLSGAAGGLGDEIEATVSRPTDTLVGFVDWAFDPPVNLSSTATFRLEVTTATWTDGTVSC